MEAFDTSILQGEQNPIMSYHITLGQSNSSKGVMFVLYAISKKINTYTSPIYLGQLALRFEDAVIAARNKIKNFQINVDDDETFRQRREPKTMPFGKYKGMTIEEIFDKDYKYIFWLATSDSRFYIKSKCVLEAIEAYKLVAKDLVVEANKINSSSIALPIEDKLVERTLNCYKSTPSDSFHGVNSFNYSFTDATGNKFRYTGSKNIEMGEQTLKCKVVKNFESLGIIFNVIKLR